MLLDEALAGLRPGESEPTVEFLRELNRRQGIAILLIEHVMRAVMALAQRVVVLHQGEVLASGTPEAIVREPTLTLADGEPTTLAAGGPWTAAQAAELEKLLDATIPLRRHAHAGGANSGDPDDLILIINPAESKHVRPTSAVCTLG